MVSRFNDLAQMHLGEGACLLEEGSISFFVEARKDGQFEGVWVTVAQPAIWSTDPVYALRELRAASLERLGRSCLRKCRYRRPFIAKIESSLFANIEHRTGIRAHLKKKKP